MPEVKMMLCCVLPWWVHWFLTSTYPEIRHNASMQ
ncbi:hypothetical protein DPX39_100169000 [Trypanosoma brucei equiperdum]|uniref:Uncharacterized protein n=1 Tax=Trypanosoma brucei equiperdum TaxID=630700 RepID=A0A3L6L3A7_9TRYP|nr:hypothetical protein DPX39_100169000 [Trypanosoma brucei equiperdum]